MKNNGFQNTGPRPIAEIEGMMQKILTLAKGVLPPGYEIAFFVKHPGAKGRRGTATMGSNFESDHKACSFVMAMLLARYGINLPGFPGE